MDVTVRGAGIFGLSIALACAHRGARVQVLDPAWPFGAPRGQTAGPAAGWTGASGGVVGALAPHTPDRWNAKKAFQFAALDMAEAYWREIAQATGVDPGYARAGRMQPLADDRAVAQARARAADAAANWGAAYAWQVVAGPAPMGLTSPTGLFLHDTLSARLQPRRALSALAAAIQACGGRIDADGAEAGPVVEATGSAGLARLSRALGVAVGGAEKGQAAVLGAAVPPGPQVFADGLHIVPHADGTVAVGSTSERAFDDPHATDARLDDVIARARTLAPALGQAPVVTRWAGLRPRAASRAPMLGPDPTAPGRFIANGGFKIGFGIAPMVGEVMADLILDGTDRIPPEFSVAASLPEPDGGHP